MFAGHTVTQTFSFTGHRHLFVAAAIVSRQGVAVFFLISGFLLYRPFLTARRDGRRHSLREFTFRRVVRIVPAYWVALTVLLVAGLGNGVTGHNWWVIYGFGQVYSLSTIGDGITQGWTLCVEVTFYAALPLFALLAARLARGRAASGAELLLLALVAVASLAFRAHFSGPAQYPTASTLPGMAVWFALGMGLAIVSVSAEARPLSRVITGMPGLSWTAALLLGGCLYLWSVEIRAGAALGSVVTTSLYGLVALLVLLPATFAAERGGWPRRVLRHPAMAWVGLVSYAFYLYHPAVIDEVVKACSGVSLTARYLLVVIVSLPVTCACAALSYYLLERPLLNTRWRPWRTATGALSAGSGTRAASGPSLSPPGDPVAESA